MKIRINFLVSLALSIFISGVSIQTVYAPRLTKLAVDSLRNRIAGQLDMARRLSPQQKVAELSRIRAAIMASSELKNTYPEWVKQVNAEYQAAFGALQRAEPAAQTKPSTPSGGQGGQAVVIGNVPQISQFTKQQIDEYVNKVIVAANVLPKTVDVFEQIGQFAQFTKPADVWAEHATQELQTLRQIVALHTFISAFHEKELLPKWPAQNIAEVQEFLKLTDPAVTKQKIQAEVSWWILFDLLEKQSPAVLKALRDNPAMGANRGLALFTSAFNTAKMIQINENSAKVEESLIQLAGGETKLLKALGVTNRDALADAVVTAQGKKKVLDMVPPAQGMQANQLITQLQDLTTKYYATEKELGGALKALVMQGYKPIEPEKTVTEMAATTASAAGTAAAAAAAYQAPEETIQPEPEMKKPMWKKVVPFLLAAVILGGSIGLVANAYNNLPSEQKTIGNAMAKVGKDTSEAITSLGTAIKAFTGKALGKGPGGSEKRSDQPPSEHGSAAV